MSATDVPRAHSSISSKIRRRTGGRGAGAAGASEETTGWKVRPSEGGRTSRRPALPRAPALAVLPGGGRPRRDPPRLRRREREGERAALPPSGPGGRGQRAPAGPGARGRHRLRPLRDQRDHPVHAGRADGAARRRLRRRRRAFPAYAAIYAARDWRMFPGIERVYVNAKARDALGWRPRHDLGTALARPAAGEETVSQLARRIGTKGYHDGEVAGRPSPLR